MIATHVGGGVTWLSISLAIALRRRAGRWLLYAQFAAQCATLLAGILLWNRLHSGGMGPVEHFLVVGTFAAIVALGLQLGVVGLLNAPLAGGALGIYWASVVLLSLAGAAMVGSRLI